MNVYSDSHANVTLGGVYKHAYERLLTFIKESCHNVMPLNVYERLWTFMNVY